MAFDDLRAVALDATFDLLGLPITITRPEPDALPIASTGVWLLPLDELRVVGTDLSRRDARRVMVVRRSSAIPELVRGTIIQAAELEGGTPLLWKVDGFEQPAEPDAIRAVLTYVPQ